MEAFKTNFEQQGAALIQYHQTFLSAFEAGMEFDQEWLNQWIDDMSSVQHELQEAGEKKQIIYPETWFPPEYAPNFPVERQQLWVILESYVHMTNNRLGVSNRDEGYLAYLIRESLSAIGASRAG